MQDLQTTTYSVRRDISTMVRCDYMETMGSDTESQHSPEQQSIALTPGTEQRLDDWAQTGSFPYPELGVYPFPQAQELSRNDLRLIHHLSSVSNDLLLKGITNLSVWTQKMPKFLSIASGYPYVMHALLSFSANHLAWVTSSKDTRNLYLQHGAIALRGLHEAIGSFSHANADAILAASVLLLWQATDWRSWSSLHAGIQSVLAAMQSWKHESIFAEFIAEEDMLAVALRDSSRKASPIDPSERVAILHTIQYSLQRLQMTLFGHELELSWVNQLLAYVQQLQSLHLVQPPEEQFNCLYQLRKWLFWVPISLLQRPGGQGPAIMTIAHFYATALSLEPLFPDLGASFCSAMALAPLEAILHVTDSMPASQGHMSTSREISTIMGWPRQTALHYRNVTLQWRPSTTIPPPHPMLPVDPDTFTYPSVGNLSPAFTPSTPHYSMPPTSAPGSSYLEVPPAQASFSYGTQSWGAVPSPGLPSQPFVTPDGTGVYRPMSMGGFRTGFVPSTVFI
ncbi:Sterol uptake control protein 2 [Teratosphaeria destructans]|uniref:Sterol uptake control protein 2 n=1 Tax=Teratosphaeria destructans TaxID=418781 RepID=A0A9W7STB2_9PEZI|nr:Sterol uptake control protein 2 [Teratosphaeria destructans]